jgi:hypothetical protein
MGKVFLTTSAILGTTGGYLFAQTVVPAAPDTAFFSFEKFGVAGFLLAGAWFMIRYFMGELAKKDTQIQNNTEVLVDELRSCSESRQQLALALQELKDEIRSAR